MDVNSVTYQGWKVVDYGELHENLVAGGCANEDTTEVNTCGLVFAVVRDGVQAIARVVRADIRYSVQCLCEKVAGDTEVEWSLWGGGTPDLR